MRRRRALLLGVLALIALFAAAVALATQVDFGNDNTAADLPADTTTTAPPTTATNTVTQETSRRRRRPPRRRPRAPSAGAPAGARERAGPPHGARAHAGQGRPGPRRGAASPCASTRAAPTFLCVEGDGKELFNGTLTGARTFRGRVVRLNVGLGPSTRVTANGKAVPLTASPTGLELTPKRRTFLPLGAAALRIAARDRRVAICALRCTHAQQDRSRPHPRAGRFDHRRGRNACLEHPAPTRPPSPPSTSWPRWRGRRPSTAPSIRGCAGGPASCSASPSSGAAAGRPTPTVPVGDTLEHIVRRFGVLANLLGGTWPVTILLAATLVLSLLGAARRRPGPRDRRVWCSSAPAGAGSPPRPRTARPRAAAPARGARRRGGWPRGRAACAG